MQYETARFQARKDGISMMVLIGIVLLLMSALPEGNCREICQTRSCVAAAERVVRSLNNTIAPCDDFFEFACRGWIRKNRIPSNGNTWDVMGVVRDDVMENLNGILHTSDKKEDGRPIRLARAMYRTCMDWKNTENLGRQPLYDTFKRLGLPRSPPSDEEAKALDASKTVGMIHRYYGLNIFGKPQIRQDMKNSDINRLMMEQFSPFDANFDTYLRDPARFQNIVGAQRRYVKGMFSLGGAGQKSEEYTNEVMDFATKLAKAMATPEERSGGRYRDHYLTINGLQDATDRYASRWNWARYLSYVFEQSDVVLDRNKDTVVVIDMDYFKRVAQVLSETSPGVVARYIWFETARFVTSEAPKEFANLHSEFKKNAYGITHHTVNWYKCTKVVDETFHLALTAAYVEKHFSPQERKKATEMWNDVTASFNDMLNELQWMDSKTKAQAHRKLSVMRSFIAYPEWITDARKLEKYYEPFKVFEGRLLETHVHLNVINGREILNSWRQKQNRSKWPTSSTKVNAFHTFGQNSATIPIGMLHAPLYGNGMESLNYGAIGAIMGHELTHGFDNDGRHYDANGNYQRWWSRDTSRQFSNKIQCMINQYSGYIVNQLGNNFKVNGALTQNENIADNGGLAEAFRGYQKLKARSKPQQALPGLAKYTDEQLFFLGFAQMWCGSTTNAGLKNWLRKEVHAPHRYRVIGTLQNSADFAKAWKCSRGSPMNPERKCIVW